MSQTATAPWHDMREEEEDSLHGFQRCRVATRRLSLRGRSIDDDDACAELGAVRVRRSLDGLAVFYPMRRTIRTPCFK